MDNKETYGKSCIFRIVNGIYFYGYCYDNEPVGNFKPDITRFYVHSATALALYGLGLEIYWFPPAKITDEDIHYRQCTRIFSFFNIMDPNNMHASLCVWTYC